jgi:hypothetical protein
MQLTFHYYVNRFKITNLPKYYITFCQFGGNDMKIGLNQRLEQTGVVCAEGYLFEMERRGYLTAGEFVPEVALENPDALKGLHKDFQHAGSDVVVAFTYNGHREKMRIIGKEDLLEPLNRAALQIANEVAADVPEGYEPNLVAGNISNSNMRIRTTLVVNKKFAKCSRKWSNGLWTKEWTISSVKPFTMPKRLLPPLRLFNNLRNRR